MPRPASNAVSFHVWTVPGVCPATRRQWADFLAALAVLLGSPKIVCRLRTRRVECSKLGKTQLIQDAGRGMVRNTGFYDQNRRCRLHLERCVSLTSQPTAYLLPAIAGTGCFWTRHRRFREPPEYADRPQLTDQYRNRRLTARSVWKAACR